MGNSHLAQLRKNSPLTQSELAKKMGLPAAYGQKKVSQWEAGHAKPNKDEQERLAKILGVSPDELGLALSEPGGQSSLELAGRLLTSNRPSLFAICFSGRPRIMSDSVVRAKFVQAMKRNLSVAMFVPFPTIAPSTPSSSRMLLAGYYSRVWGSVLEVREKLQAEIGRDHNIGLYGPRNGGEPWLIPPFGSRYALLLEKNDQGDAEKSLYISVETSRNKNLQLVGTTNDDASYEEIQNWEAFFNPVVAAWMSTDTLPRNECGNWQHIQEPSTRTIAVKHERQRSKKRA